MTTGSVRAKVGLVSALAALFLLTGASGAFAIALLGLGVVSIFLAPRRTGAVRAATLVFVSIALVAGDKQAFPFFALGAILVWPPAFLVAWVVGQEPEDATADTPGAPGGRRARIATAAIVIAAACGSVAFRALSARGLEQSAALFVGIPTLLAVSVVFFVSPRSAVGVACKAVTVGLLISLLLLGEGMVCVAMSAPLFYLVAVIVAGGTSRLRRARGRTETTLLCVAVLALLPMSLEGVTERSSFNRDEWVTVTRIVAAAPEAVEQALFAAPRFDRALPAYLAIGFPRPTAARIEREEGGARWVIRFRGGEMRIDGLEPRDGDLVLDLEESRPGLLRWRALSDDSHMTHYLQWRESYVVWERVDARTTRVSWTLRYRRGLDPAWYLGPWERYAVRLAAGYLIDTVATP